MSHAVLLRRLFAAFAAGDALALHAIEADRIAEIPLQPLDRPVFDAFRS